MSRPVSRGRPASAATIGSTAACDVRSAQGARQVSIVSTPASMARSSDMYAIPLVKCECTSTGIESSCLRRPTRSAASSGARSPAMSLMQRLSAPIFSMAFALLT